MRQPKVSVIIPVYNAENFIDRCISSVVNQTYSCLEIILVDDGSPDLCPEICDDWVKKDSRIRVIHKENAGAGMARNTGLEAATGEYLLFVDSDDYIDPNTVQRCVETAEKDKSDMVLYGRKDVSVNGTEQIQPILTGTYYFSGSDVTEKVLAGLFNHSMGFGVGVCGKLIKSSAVRSGNVTFRSEREILSEDAFFLIELFAHIGAVSVLPENYYYYVHNANSFSHTIKKDWQTMNDRFLNGCIEKCKELGYSEKVVSRLKVRYQIYSLEGIKQFAALGISKKEKKKHLKTLMKNQVLRSTLSNDVLRLNKRGARVFWQLFKMKQSSLCCFLLQLKLRK